jgi:Protein of unknown function (DUF1403)
MDLDIATLPEGLGSTLRRRGKARKATSSAATPNPLILQPLPRWITSSQVQAVGARQESQQHVKDAAFAAGAAIFALDQILRADPSWLGCWRMRHALKAAGVAAKLLRLDADEAALRDAEHLTRPGDDPGPAGRLLRLLRQLTSRPTLRADEMLLAIATDIDGASAESEVLALLQADVVLAERLGWERPLLLHLTGIFDPALRQGVAGKRPRADGPDWGNLQHVVLAHAAVIAHAQAVTLARKAQALTAAAHGLRTRDEGRGLALILADDSVAPWRMVNRTGQGGLGSDRAARRLCESLHGLGALRLLTDRPTFRLYGL